MRWEDGPESSNVEDRRGVVTKVAAGGGIGVLVVAFLASRFLGIDFNTAKKVADTVVNVAGSKGAKVQKADPSSRPAEENKQAKFVSVILADTERVWQNQFKKMGKTYTPPKLVLFTDKVNSACGFQTAATGPFYCPGDQKAYIDLGFYKTLKDQLGAPGDFAQAYVLAHEIGHHVQNLLGTSAQVTKLQRTAKSKAEANALSVRLELQADCYAGVWAHYADKDRNMLEPGDIEEGLNAASKIGDDTLQKRAHQAVNPESFTHGTSAERMKWLKIGEETGSVEACDTFSNK